MLLTCMVMCAHVIHCQPGKWHEVVSRDGNYVLHAKWRLVMVAQ